jgi:hypothetical protein
VTGWEFAPDRVENNAELGRLYEHPADRDPTRDYTEGGLGIGNCPPEGLVYFPGVLGFYLRHRPLSRLLAPPRTDEELGKLLARVPERPK